MGKKKKIEKSLESLEKQKKIHMGKFLGEKTKNPYNSVLNYWTREIEILDKKIKELKKRIS